MKINCEKCEIDLSEMPCVIIGHERFLCPLCMRKHLRIVKISEEITLSKRRKLENILETFYSVTLALLSSVLLVIIIAALTGLWVKG